MFIKGVNFAGGAQQGERQYQQDSFGFVLPSDIGDPESLLLLVADGMGGYEGGEVASQQAVETFVRQFFEDESLDDHSRLDESLHVANRRIADLKGEMVDLRNMGTTFLCVLVRGFELRWTSVGDSPLFLYRGAELLRLNADHSMRSELEEQVIAGEITPEEASSHPARNNLLSALTGNTIARIDSPEEPFALQPGDLLLACSDGIFSLDPTRIVRALQIGFREDASAVVQRLLRDVTARRRNKQDNTTVALIRIPDQECISDALDGVTLEDPEVSTISTVESLLMPEDVDQDPPLEMIHADLERPK